MQWYFIGRYSQREEMLDHAGRLAVLGHTWRCSWITGKHESGVGDAEYDPKFAEWVALDDWGDLLAAEGVIAFTQPARTWSDSRGGRHVELGAALALGKRVVVIGYRENVFCCLPQVEFFEAWEDFVHVLDAER